MAIQTAQITALATQTAILTATEDTALTFMSLCNTDDVSVTCNVYIVPGGGGVGSAAELFIKELEIIASDTYIIYQGNEKIVLGNTDQILVELITGTTPSVTVITSYVAV